MNVLRHQVLIPLALPAALVVLALALRLVRVLWYRLRQGGFPPIVIHAADDTDSHAFAVQLSEFLTQETPGPTVIIPPGSGTPPPPVPVEQLSGRGGWVAALIRIVLSREPAFDVYVECPQQARTGTLPSEYRVIVRVTRVPGNRVLAADYLHDTQAVCVVHAAGCRVIHSIRQEPAALRHTPRWERWSPDIRGYSAYRRALDYERQGNSDGALEEYDLALVYEPGNFLINVGKATLLEVEGKFEDASEVYRTCNELWPEHVETAYRLSASYANGGDYDAAESALESIRLRLQPQSLRKEKRKTRYLARRNVGERRYWRSWSRKHPPILGSRRSSNRHHLLQAVQVAEQVREIGRIVGSRRIHKFTIDQLITKMAKLTTEWTSDSPYKNLFHPELLVEGQPEAEQPAGHHSSWHKKNNDDDDLVILPQVLARSPWLLRPKKQMGWLAHYNAACFFSLALGIDGSLLPAGYAIAEWKIDCARAAIRELGHVRRDPLSKVEPDWYRRDPELKPLTSYVSDARYARWRKLVGLEILREPMNWLGIIRLLLGRPRLSSLGSPRGPRHQARRAAVRAPERPEKFQYIHKADGARFLAPSGIGRRLMHRALSKIPRPEEHLPRLRD
jgi:tetratricopeptide (TPR) repeat protein